ncbi:hypothetical protein E4T66_19415 [Sinimarinibacterium sp. CAU 1509]|uniref:YCF48-related protein n=1 Tax=Sinimarinibacterium sp. CAU 1509 TaxID=2562283 RepID=UPI0010ACC70E|nr:YCF48-related protein [Sinimarinibacterium sp. CAU 1509]TJY56731.1 hypothetical protein E4T66_19415 [Sinimarinibacterium sp. CAU 1509]
MSIYRRTWLAVAGAAVLALSSWASAQDEAQDTPPDSSEPVQEIVKSLPSEVMPLTSGSLLLDIVNTGEHLVAVGDRGAVIVSNDGRNWAQVQVPTRSPLTSVTFVDADNGWAVGHDAVILHTTDGGQSWTLQNFAPELEKPFLDVLFLDDQRGFAVGAYSLFYETTDGGQNWTEVESPIREDEWHFNAITALGNGTLMIVGESGTLALSTDQGQTWSKLESPYDSSLFGAVPLGEKGALIYGLRGNMFVADDVAAGNWTEVTTESVASMFGSARTDDGKIVLVGLNGNVLDMDGTAQDVRVVKSKAGTPLSSAIVFGGELLAVGESGVQHIGLQ